MVFFDSGSDESQRLTMSNYPFSLIYIIYGHLSVTRYQLADLKNPKAGLLTGVMWLVWSLQRTQQVRGRWS